MLDFTSVLYLGFRHAFGALRPWTQLTTGRPAALEEAPEAVTLAQDLARLVGCERAVLAPSTLHLYWDLFDVLAGDRVAIYADAGTYPIARWGIERAAAKGVPTSTFPIHDPAALESLLIRDERARRRPIVVTDGLCTATWADSAAAGLFEADPGAERIPRHRRYTGPRNPGKNARVRRPVRPRRRGNAGVERSRRAGGNHRKLASERFWGAAGGSRRQRQADGEVRGAECDESSFEPALSRRYQRGAAGARRQ